MIGPGLEMMAHDYFYSGQVNGFSDAVYCQWYLARLYSLALANFSILRLVYLEWLQFTFESLIMIYSYRLFAGLLKQASFSPCTGCPLLLSMSVNKYHRTLSLNLAQ